MRSQHPEHDQHDGDRLWSVAEVARRLSISRASVYLLVQQRRLACHRIGVGRGAVRVSECDLQAFLGGCHQAVAQSERRPERVARPKLNHLDL